MPGKRMGIVISLTLAANVFVVSALAAEPPMAANTWPLVHGPDLNGRKRTTLFRSL